MAEIVGSMKFPDGEKVVDMIGFYDKLIIETNIAVYTCRIADGEVFIETVPKHAKGEG